MKKPPIKATNTTLFTRRQFLRRTTIAAGMLDNTPDNLSKWLHNPEVIKPGNDMSGAMSTVLAQWGPDADKNIAMLVAYLEGLK